MIGIPTFLGTSSVLLSNFLNINMVCDEGDDMELGPLGINYMKMYKCEMEGYESLTMILFLAWAFFLIYLCTDY